MLLLLRYYSFFKLVIGEFEIVGWLLDVSLCVSDYNVLSVQALFILFRYTRSLLDLLTFHKLTYVVIILISYDCSDLNSPRDSLTHCSVVPSSHKCALSCSSMIAGM